MAHVLLGSYKYSYTDLKQLESDLVIESRTLGRDVIHFHSLNIGHKKGTCLERVAKTVADTFGAAGDPFGLRDR